MNTGEKVIALLRFYSKRYDLSSTDWLEGLIELESSPVGGDAKDGAKFDKSPYRCIHCGRLTKYGMGAKHHHTTRHASCTDRHEDMRKGE